MKRVLMTLALACVGVALAAGQAAADVSLDVGGVEANLPTSQLGDVGSDAPAVDVTITDPSADADAPVCIASTCDADTDNNGTTADADAPVCVLADCSSGDSGGGTAGETPPTSGDGGSGTPQPEQPPADQPEPEQPPAEQPPAEQPPVEPPPAELPPTGLLPSDLLQEFLGLFGTDLLPADLLGLLPADLVGLLGTDLLPSVTAIGDVLRLADTLASTVIATISSVTDGPPAADLPPTDGSVTGIEDVLRLADTPVSTVTGTIEPVTNGQLPETPATPAVPQLDGLLGSVGCTCQGDVAAA